MSAFIEQYLADSQHLFRTLEEACASGDAKGLAQAAHDLRPHAHYMGAQELLNLLITIDQEARLSPPVVRTDLVNGLLKKVGPLNEALRKAMDPIRVP